MNIFLTPNIALEFRPHVQQSVRLYFLPALQLKKDIEVYYGYNRFMVDTFLALFTTAEALELIEANESPRPVTLRVNTLKVQRIS